MSTGNTHNLLPDRGLSLLGNPKIETLLFYYTLFTYGFPILSVVLSNFFLMLTFFTLYFFAQAFKEYCILISNFLSLNNSFCAAAWSFRIKIIRHSFTNELDT